MKTLREAFCEKYDCPESQFVDQAFNRCLPFHAHLLRPFCFVTNPGHFDADIDLLQGVASATTMNRVREEITDYFTHYKNRGWLRQRAHVRISTRKLKLLARELLRETPASQTGNRLPQFG